MKVFFGLALLGLCLGGVQVGGAQAPARAPAGATGICRDGSYSTAASKDGACRGHKGVQTWYSAGTSTMPAPVPAAGKPPTAMPAPTPSGPVQSRPAATPSSAPPAAMPAPTKLGPAGAAAQKTAAPGGGPGLVWVNGSSNVYHCYGDAFYGKTKQGSYMSESDAKAKGAHGVRGQSCSAK